MAPLILEVGDRVGESGHLHTIFALAREDTLPIPLNRGMS